VSRYQELHALEDEDWRHDAACAGYPTSWWYPPDGMNANYTRRARNICEACPVREDCLIAAMRRNEDGIWGGMNIKERRRLRRDFQVMKRLVCIQCRAVFEKPADRQIVTLYCSDECRKGRRIRRESDAKRWARAAS
jgi:WhiB family redox-sensing transcriptional regulator